MYGRTLLTVVFALMTTAAWAVPFQVDLSQSGHIEPGWIDWNTGGAALDNSNVSKQFLNQASFDDDFTIDFVKIDSRNRGSVDNAVPLHDLLDDAFKESDPFNMVIKGLALGTYAIRTWHHDPKEDVTNDDGTLNITVKDADGTRLVADHLQQSWGPNPGTPASTTFMFRSDGVNNIVITFGDNNDGIHNEAYLNGFQIDLAIDPMRASGPRPSDVATDLPRDVVLSWQPGQYAATHDVYLGTVFADVNTASRTDQKGVLVSQGQDANTYDPAGPLAFGQTYYWRIDEVNAPPSSTIYKTRVWSFTVEPVGYAIKPVAATASSSQTADTMPGKTIDGSGLNASDQHSALDTAMWLSSIAGPQPTWIRYDFDKVYKLHQMWVWNSNQILESVLGFGAKDVTVEYSTDANNWTPLAGVSQFARAIGAANYVHNTTVDFGGVAARYVRITIKSNWGGMLPQYGLSEVRVFQIPARAREPQPASAATAVALDATLRWRAGREAARHEVFFGTDPNAVRDATTPVQTVTDSSCSLASLSPEYGRTYYWKVNEVNDAASPTSWNGDVWRLSTVGYAVVDNFETYDDTCNRIFFAWVDGLGHSGSVDCGISPSGGNGTGSAVGNMSAPFAEKTIRNSGAQSMPMTYDNSMGKLYSETQREWTSPQVWTGGGANTLVVYFRGNAPAFLETSPGNIVMNGMGTDIFGTTDQGRFAYKQLSGDGSITARVDDLANTNSWAKAGVMIRETLDAGSSYAFTLYGGQNGAHLQARLTTGASAISDSTISTSGQNAARAPVWIKLERKGNQFNGYYATDIAGTAWTTMAWNPQTINMTADVYIGLAVTSHAAGVVCGARFSSVSTTGKVTGNWQQANLGAVDQSTASGNAPEAFYVAVEDIAKHLKVVSNPDPVLISTGAWEQWQIPLSTFTSAGVNLSSIKKVVIGVGDRNSPKVGGVGKLYIDDIRVTRIATP